MENDHLGRIILINLNNLTKHLFSNNGVTNEMTVVESFLQHYKKRIFMSFQYNQIPPDFFAAFAQNSFARIGHVTPNLVTFLSAEKSPFFELFAAVEHFEPIKCRPFGVNF
jgi:hypothetical protein